ncbi:hypothetical protein [Allomesorhizobium alhagi]|uniref:Uncharacterized protein n=1 Tax=Mesorhizobium alhagi CCNWXJ12-2 TaxID=1107882 RepID=H0I0Z9_9HYPH|nr:hypothetical protein [Mesorhizobium alhagi]EHK53361.1 hypothetical protein MAXJ12_30682 [Mesorhizobium alhagi CCNWXJ12-2]
MNERLLASRVGAFLAAIQWEAAMIIMLTDYNGIEVGVNADNVLFFIRYPNNRSTTVQFVGSGGQSPTQLMVQETVDEIRDLINRFE